MSEIKILESKKHNDFEKGPLRRSLFSNGATSLFHQVKGRAGATVSLYFIVGSQDEKENEYGISHLLEHMMFKEGGEQKIVRYLETHGADINAYTYKEYICFELSCLSKKLPEFLPLFLELFLHPHFNESDFNLEKQVVMQEIREDEDDHDSFGYEYIIKNIYPKEIGHPIAGTEKSVSKIDFDHLMKYYKKHFSPEKMILTVTSGDSFLKLEKILLNVFQKYNLSKIKKPIRLKPKSVISPIKTFRKTLTRKVENPILFMGFQAPSLESDFYYDFVVLQDILCQGLSSRLYIELREKEALVYGLESDFASFLKYGHFVMTFHPPKDKLFLVRKKVMSVLQEYAFEGIDDELIQKSKERIVEFWDYAFDDMGERADFLAMQEIYGFKNFSIKPQLKKLSQVTSRRIQKKLKTCLEKNYFELLIKGKNERA